MPLRGTWLDCGGGFHKPADLRNKSLGRAHGGPTVVAVATVRLLFADHECPPLRELEEEHPWGGGSGRNEDKPAEGWLLRRTEINEVSLWVGGGGDRQLVGKLLSERPGRRHDEDMKSRVQAIEETATEIERQSWDRVLLERPDGVRSLHGFIKAVVFRIFVLLHGIFSLHGQNV